MLTEELNQIKEESDKDLSEVKNPKELEEFRIKYLSRNGLIAHLFEELKKVSKEEKPLVGKSLNEFRNFLTEKFNLLKSDLENSNGTRIRLKSKEELEEVARQFNLRRRSKYSSTTYNLPKDLAKISEIINFIDMLRSAGKYNL